MNTATEGLVIAPELIRSSARQWWDSLNREERDGVLLVADAMLCRRASAYEAYLIYLDLFASEHK